MNPTRRTMLGATAASLLGTIALPWRPKETDILIANEMPPSIPVVPASVRRTSDFAIEPGQEFVINGVRFVVTRYSMEFHRLANEYERHGVRHVLAEHDYGDLMVEATSISDVSRWRN